MINILSNESAALEEFGTLAIDFEDQVYTNCIVRKAVYDCGSSNSKFALAEIDICTHQIKILSETREQLHYASDLKKSIDGCFSDDIKAKAISAIISFKSSIENIFGLDIEHCGVATAAFRAAKNGIEFSQDIAISTGVKLEVISHKQEGELAFWGAMYKAKAADPYNSIIWDIGGASQQFTAREETGSYIVYGNQIAASNFKALVLEKIKSGNASPNPMHQNETSASIELARSELRSDDVLPWQLGHTEDEVYGVGAVHNFIIKHYVSFVSGASKTEYTLSQVKSVIDFLTDKSDAEIMSIMSGTPDPEFVKSELTSIILVYATMLEFGINRVQVLNTNNIDGILAKGC
jgi:exopolyphosphatase/guanosine-5'-triphosphate,3'-diphosphate pyrophosphatase